MPQVQTGLELPDLADGQNAIWRWIELDDYGADAASYRLTQRISNPSWRGVRVLLNVDNVTTGREAAATAVLTADAVTSIVVDEGGYGYASAPTVVFTGGGGTGAAATATLTNGVVTSIAVDNGGSGYTTPPTISFTGGGTLGNLKVGIETVEPASDLRHTLLESAAITTTGLKVYTVYPGATVAANVSASAALGDGFYVRITHSAAGQWRYNAALQFLV